VGGKAAHEGEILARIVAAQLLSVRASWNQSPDRSPGAATPSRSSSPLTRGRCRFSPPCKRPRAQGIAHSLSNPIKV